MASSSSVLETKPPPRRYVTLSSSSKLTFKLNPAEFKRYLYSEQQQLFLKEGEAITIGNLEIKTKGACTSDRIKLEFQNDNVRLCNTATTKMKTSEDPQPNLAATAGRGGWGAQEHCVSVGRERYSYLIDGAVEFKFVCFAERLVLETSVLHEFSTTTTTTTNDSHANSNINNDSSHAASAAAAAANDVMVKLLLYPGLQVKIHVASLRKSHPRDHAEVACIVKKPLVVIFYRAIAIDFKDCSLYSAKLTTTTTATTAASGANGASGASGGAFLFWNLSEEEEAAWTSEPRKRAHHYTSSLYSRIAANVHMKRSKSLVELYEQDSLVAFCYRSPRTGAVYAGLFEKTASCSSEGNEISSFFAVLDTPERRDLENNQPQYQATLRVADTGDLARREIMFNGNLQRKLFLKEDYAQFTIIVAACVSFVLVVSVAVVVFARERYRNFVKMQEMYM